MQFNQFLAALWVATILPFLVLSAPPPAALMVSPTFAEAERPVTPRNLIWYMLTNDADPDERFRNRMTSALKIERSDQDPGMVIYFLRLNGKQSLVVDFMPTPPNMKVPALPGWSVSEWSVGQTRLKNGEIINPKTGVGIISEAMFNGWVFRTGGGTDETQYIRTIIKLLNPQAKKMYKDAFVTAERLRELSRITPLIPGDPRRFLTRLRLSDSAGDRKWQPRMNQKPKFIVSHPMNWWQTEAGKNHLKNFHSLPAGTPTWRPRLSIQQKDFNDWQELTYVALKASEPTAMLRDGDDYLRHAEGALWLKGTKTMPPHAIQFGNIVAAEYLGSAEAALFVTRYPSSTEKDRVLTYPTSPNIVGKEKMMTEYHSLGWVRVLDTDQINALASAKMPEKWSLEDGDSLSLAYSCALALGVPSSNKALRALWETGVFSREYHLRKGTETGPFPVKHFSILAQADGTIRTADIVPHQSSPVQVVSSAVPQSDVAQGELIESASGAIAAAGGPSAALKSGSQAAGAATPESAENPVVAAGAADTGIKDASPATDTHSLLPEDWQEENRKALQQQAPQQEVPQAEAAKPATTDPFAASKDFPLLDTGEKYTAGFPNAPKGIVDNSKIPTAPNGVNTAQGTKEVAMALCARGLGVSSCNNPLLQGSGRSALIPGSSAQIAYARVGGILSNVMVAGLELVTAASIAAMVAMPAFIIIDYLTGHTARAAFGTVSLVLAAASLVISATPLAPVAGVLALLSAIFAIIPMLFDKSQAELPSARSATEIIQYAMFGDRSHTGNEKCRQGTPTQPGNPNCTILYGPTVLSQVFGWNSFDAIVYLIQFNQGYPMTITDMANTFTEIHANGSPAPKNTIASISCRKDPVCGRLGCPAGRTQSCRNPQFLLNRQEIHLPVLNQTADQIYNRIMPSPGGDCKLVADVTLQQDPTAKMNITGAPVAIACNITASADDGTVSNMDGSLSAQQVDSLHAPAAASTDLVVHEDAAPEPPMGFPPVLNEGNALCFDDNKLCLPNGTYDVQLGTPGSGVDFRKISSLTMPVGASMKFDIQTGRFTIEKINYSANQTSTGNGNFTDQMAKFGEQNQGRVDWRRTFEAIVPGPTAPVLCLFTELSYRGQCECYGAGSGNISSGMTDQAQSITLHGDIKARAYGIEYGDGSSLLITTSVPDLTVKPLGPTGSFNKAIKALWIEALSDMAIPGSPSSLSEPSITVAEGALDLSPSTNETIRLAMTAVSEPGPPANETADLASIGCSGLSTGSDSFNTSQQISSVGSELDNIYCEFLAMATPAPANFSRSLSLSNSTAGSANLSSLSSPSSIAFSNPLTMITNSTSGPLQPIIEITRQNLTCPAYDASKIRTLSLMNSTLSPVVLSESDILVIFCASLNNETAPLYDDFGILKPWSTPANFSGSLLSTDNATLAAVAAEDEEEAADPSDV